MKINLEIIFLVEWGYNNLFTSLDNNSSSIDDVVENFSTLLFDDAYQYFGKTVRPEDRTARHPRTNSWFDNTCKIEKQNFNRAKHEYSRCRSDLNRANVTRCRTKLNKAKRRAKAIFTFEEGKRVQKIAKSNSKQFWKEIKKYIKRKGQSSDELSADDFFEHFSSVFQAHPTENNPEIHKQAKMQISFWIILSRKKNSKRSLCHLKITKVQESTV